MTDINAVLAANHDAIKDLIAAAEKSADSWTVPRTPGKWSPCQVVEHVALVLDESANMVSGTATKLPSIPVFLRPILRTLFFNRVLRKNAFINAKTGKAFDPTGGPADPAAARVRLEQALVKFDQACRARMGAPTIVSGFFGTISVADYARFQELHTRHHRKQIG
jgi:hypothetical protein